MASKGAAGRKVVVQSINVPGYTGSVDAEHYEAMKKVLLKILPQEGSGLTQSEMWSRAAAAADPRLFPGHGKVGWWMKTVQLDLEANGLVVRDKGAKPLRWRRV